MSLIHDALKKSEKKGVAGPLIPPIVSCATSGRHALSARTMVLIALVVVAIVIAIYMNFFAGASRRVPAPLAPVTGQSAGTLPQSAEIAQLKSSAEQLFEAGEYDQASAVLMAAQKASPNDYEVINNLGMVAKRRGRSDEAMAYFEKALTMKPDCAVCLNNAASIDIERGDLMRAQARLIQALKIDAAYAEANFHMALVSEASGKPQEAVKYYLIFLDYADGLSPVFLEDVRAHVLEIQE